MAQNHPAVDQLLTYFDYSHLPDELADVSKPFCALATRLADNPDLEGRELTIALRKLLEAKDAAVRSMLA
jgi:hypothetical protein